ncbi:hepatic lectin [Aplysia californica]|uniref:Hepatic lectin n=1 Tax=Aplysia californica TaxID=6500 RepID=A0ABM0K6K1_APLCA|nr:hepatic lectin [Aplysia californica]
MDIRNPRQSQLMEGRSRFCINKYNILYLLKSICVIVASLCVSAAAIIVIVNSLRGVDKVPILSVINQASTNIIEGLSSMQEKFANLEQKVFKVVEEITTPSQVKLCSYSNGCELKRKQTMITHCYRVFQETPLTWGGARKKCELLGGFLAEIHDHASLEYVNRLFARSGNSLWVGASDQGQEGNWIWVMSKKPLVVEDWRLDQPDNYKGNEHCLQIKEDSGKYWNDLACNTTLGYLCQKDMDDCDGWLQLQ